MTLRFLAPLSVLLAGCATSPPPPRTQVLGPGIVDTDRGGIEGRWRSADGRLTFSTMMADTRGGLTFIAARGCAIAQGVMRPEADLYRVELYPNRGFAFDGCRRTRNDDPVLVPFNGERLLLERSGASLFARGTGGSLTLQRDTIADLMVSPEFLHGRWRLQGVDGASGATLTLSDDGYRLESACGFVAGDGWVTDRGLGTRLAGRFRTQSPPCRARTPGGRLLAATSALEMRYDLETGALVVTVPRGGGVFVRG